MAATQEKTYTRAYLIGALIFGLFVGSLLTWGWASTFTTEKIEEKEIESAPKVLAPVTEETTAVTPTNELAVYAPGYAPISVSDQPAGFSINLSLHAVTPQTWVVIHEERFGAPGNALGAARFIHGETTGIVELLRGTKMGAPYYALLYTDDGDGIFSLEKDTPVRNEDGKLSGVQFMSL